MWNPIERELSMVVEPKVSPYRGPLYFARIGTTITDSGIIANGGFGLVDTGERQLLVTCNHVWEGFQTEQRNDPDLRLHLCLDLVRKQAVIAEWPQLIDCDQRLDIATFDIAPLRSACGGRKFYPVRRGSAPSVRKGDKLVVLGNQGANRRVGEDGLEFGLTVYALYVSSVDGFRFHADMKEVKMRNVRPPVRSAGESPHGGISGNPCFLVRPNGLCPLVGFTTADCLGLLWFTHVSSLNPDGTINRTAP